MAGCGRTHIRLVRGDEPVELLEEGATSLPLRTELSEMAKARKAICGIFVNMARAPSICEK